METISCVYVILNIRNGKYYIGSTRDLHKRWINHLNKLRNNKHHAIKLQRAFNKYGEESFQIRVLEVVDDTSKLIEREQMYLDHTECYKKGYNTNKEAHTFIRKSPLTEEHKRSISKGNTGKVRSEDVKKRISEALSGRKQSEETIAKRAEKLRGKVRSEESRERYRKSKLGTRAPMSKLSEEQVVNIWDRLQAKVPTKEIAKEFKVSASTISEIKHRAKWTHITDSLESLEDYAPYKKGSNNPQSKLTDTDVIDILTRYSNKEATQAELARQYNVSRYTINAIVLNKSWKHIERSNFYGKN